MHIHDAGKAIVTALRHDNHRELVEAMDTAGWAAAEDVLKCRKVSEHRMTEDDLRNLIEIENEQKVRIQVSQCKGVMHVRAAQGRSGGASKRLDMVQVLPAVVPGD